MEGESDAEQNISQGLDGRFAVYAKKKKKREQEEQMDGNTQ